ncbi:MAG: patatin [Frankiales bacterium]|nr:patatin [Frankiales bacterium]
MRVPGWSEDPLRRVLWLIAVVTLLSGLALLVLPGPLLTLLDAPTTPLARHEFAIVGMFMAVVGGLTVQAYADPAAPAYVLAWSAAQKLGAAVAVGLAVARDLFSGLALLLAAFDLVTGVLTLVLLARRSSVHVAPLPVRA